MRAYLNDGFGFASSNSAWLPPVYFDIPFQDDAVDAAVRFADVNADGRTDLVLHASDAALYPSRDFSTDPNRVWLNTGHPDHVQGLWVEDAAWDLPAGAAFVDAQGRDTGVRFIDLNGDGAPDLLRAVEVSGGATQTEAWLNLGAAPDRLETVTTPLGGELTFEYGSKVEYGAAQPLPVHVVTDIRADDADGTGPEARTEFFYDGGFFDPVDQEFRGFATVTAHRWVEDDQGTPVVDRETVTTYHQDPERAGLPERTEVRDGVGGPLLLATEVTYTPDLDGPPYISLPSETRRFEYDGNASARETKRTFTYDFELCWMQATTGRRRSATRIRTMRAAPISSSGWRSASRTTMSAASSRRRSSSMTAARPSARCQASAT